jgi:membrane protease YdiL (CAAX protease family)
MINLIRGIIWYVIVVGMLSIFYWLDLDRYIAGIIAQLLFLGFSIAPVLVARENGRALGLVKIKWRAGTLVFLITAAVAFVYCWIDTSGSLELPEWNIRLLYGIALAPVAEELFFRGYLQPVLQYKAGKWKGLIVTALLFSAAHSLKIFILQEASPWFLIVAFVLGIVYGFVRYKTGSVYNAMLSHAAYNITAIFFFSA